MINHNAATDTYTLTLTYDQLVSIQDAITTYVADTEFAETPIGMTPETFASNRASVQSVHTAIDAHLTAAAY